VLLLAMFNYQLPELWSAIVLTGLAGAVLFVIVAILESKLAWWQEEL
jgi:ABC-type nitrate/sulfonate/bicarbonate transport system permease component